MNRQQFADGAQSVLTAITAWVNSHPWPAACVFSFVVGFALAKII